MNKIKLLCALFALCSTAHTSAVESTQEAHFQTEGEKEWKEKTSRIIQLDKITQKMMHTFSEIYKTRIPEIAYTQMITQKYGIEEANKILAVLFANESLGKKRIEVKEKLSDEQLFYGIKLCADEFYEISPDAEILSKVGRKFFEQKGDIGLTGNFKEGYETVKSVIVIGIWKTSELIRQADEEYRTLIDKKKKKFSTVDFLGEKPFEPQDNDLQGIAERIEVCEHDDSPFFQSPSVKELWKLKEHKNPKKIVSNFNKITLAAKCNLLYKGNMMHITVDDQNHLNNVLGYVIKNKGQINNPEIKKQFDGAELQQLISLAEKIHKLDAIATEFTQEVAKKKQALPEID